MTWVAGVDGCKGGWFAVFFKSKSCQFRWERFERLTETLAFKPKAKVVAVDVPIGLLDQAEPGGRCCDRLARELLGQHRARSVFSPPVRAALQHEKSYEKALRANRKSSLHNIGISKQAHALFPKIREANPFPKVELDGRVYEVHPELCFFQMNGCKPLNYGKKAKQRAGIDERRALLEKTMFGKVVAKILGNRPEGVSQDDALDAIAACWTALRISKREQIPVGGKPPTIWR